MKLKNMVESHFDYSELRKKLEQSGLLKPTPFYYVVIFFFYLNLLAILLWLINYFNKWYITALLAFPVSVVCMQFGYLGHDAGHRAISKKSLWNSFIGQISLSLITGFSFTSWVKSHNEHHAYPNHEDLDPDIKDGTPFSFTEKKAMQRYGLIKLITRLQTLLLVPALFTFFFIKRYIYARPAFKNKSYLDLVFLAMHYTLFFGLITYFIGIWQAILLYCIISMLMGLFFGFSFLPNHLGMPILIGDSNISYLKKQILTSRDVKGNFFLRFITGSLNYQIEHHLFPTMSRKHLTKAKIIIKNFCYERGIPYKDDSLYAAWKEVFAYINRVSKKAGYEFYAIKAVNDMI